MSFNETLERFNRKERNLLIRTVLGHSQDVPLRLPESFCNQLTDALELPRTKPEEVRWWTDYHLNWLVAALKIFGDETAIGRRHINPAIKPNLEDLDLLVGIDGPKPQLIGIEAKNRHFNREDKEQIKSKLERLDPLYHLFSDVGIGFHFMFMTPLHYDPTKGLELSSWPWVYKKSWLHLMPCDAEQPLLLECSRFAPGRREGEKYWRCIP